MTYKIKSLLYFCSFLIASTIYYGIEQYDKFQEQVQSQEVAETEFADTLEHEEILEGTLDTSK